MTRQIWNEEDDNLLVEIVNEASSRGEAIAIAAERLGRTESACSQRVSVLRRRGAEVKQFRTPSRVITEYAKEIGNELRNNPGNIAGTIRSISERTNIPTSTLSQAWYSRRGSLTDNRGRSMIFFSLMGDKSHPNTKVVTGNSTPKRTKGLWKKLIEALRR